jgi:glyoxylase-like metal-dependent hydrolase (beta-lactamase superfamily II)
LEDALVNVLNEKGWGHVRVVRGEENGRFPNCNTILVADEVNAIVDPGAGQKTLENVLKDHRVDLVINTHYHFDHIRFNYLFRDAEIHLNKYDAPCFKSLDALAERLGILDVYGVRAVKRWKRTISSESREPLGPTPKDRHEWILSTSRLDGEYKDGKVFDFGATKARAIHTPGHTAGFCCLHFPIEKMVYAADIDLTSFGPWYGGTDGDIQLFLDSMEKVTKLNADIYVTGHEIGIVRKPEFIARLEKFKSKIFERDTCILEFLRRRGNGATLTDIASEGLIYSREFLVDEWIYMWQRIMIRKHLERLESLGLVGLEGNKYFVTEKEKSG